MKRILYVTINALLLTACSTYQVQEDKNGIQKNQTDLLNNPYVVMISIDGFRHDYIKKYRPPFLSKIVTKGIQAKRLTPAFPSKTFPNHYSLITGLYPGHHGLVANRFYDPTWKEDYQIGDAAITQNGKWYGGSPLWLEVRDQGLLSASFFWVGSDANIRNHYPNYYIPYNHGLKNDFRTKQVSQWLDLPKEKRPHFLTLYFSDVDSIGHRFGPHSNEVEEAVLRIDKLIADMVKEIDRKNLNVNFVIVSDHGMKAIENAKKVYLKSYVDTSLAQFKERGPLTLIYLNNKNDIPAYKEKLTKVPFTKVYLRNELPKKFQVQDNPRFGDLLLLAEPGAYIYPQKTPPQNPKREGTSGGTHGYDPYITEEMGGIFLSFGPRVKNKGLIKTMDNIHVYPFVLDLLKLDIPKGIDGKREILAPYVIR